MPEKLPRLIKPSQMKQLRSAYGELLQENVVMANYTTAHIGGKADALLAVYTIDELVNAVRILHQMKLPYRILGSGSNVLVADAGIREVIILNHAHTVKIDTRKSPPSVWAESGANFGSVVRQVALRGLSGLEWAAGIPGSFGGAIYGNAGAFGSDISCSLILAEILHPVRGREIWERDQIEYQYRSSNFKRNHSQEVILAARLALKPDDKDVIETRMDEIKAKRRLKQPSGNSMGSIFKNPPGDHAARLIDCAGLKGTRIGDAEISMEHANIFVNRGNATAKDFWALITLAHDTVAKMFNINLELEIERIGDWQEANGIG